LAFGISLASLAETFTGGPEGHLVNLTVALDDVNGTTIPVCKGSKTPPKHNNSDDNELGLESGESDDWNEDYDGKLSKDEEEEVKKVGGWLLFASIVLMIYTAYQMLENPDGICAR
jgi:hypothetical protein